MKKESTTADRIFDIVFVTLTVAIVIISFLALSETLNPQIPTNTYGVHHSIYTEEDVHMLGDLMYAGTKEELKGVPEQDAKRAMKLWGQVALNWLSIKGEYNNTKLEDVIFSHLYTQEVQDKIGNINTPEEVYRWAEELLQDSSYAPGNLLHSVYVPLENHKEYEHIGGIYFYLD